MTLGGMAAAVGLIIDDAIVMIEHIERRLRRAARAERGRAPSRGRRTNSCGRCSGSSAATIIIFVPLAFLSGVTGAFFKALSLTMAVALVVSFLIAWLVVPILVERLLGDQRRESRELRRARAASGRATARLLEAQRRRGRC